MEKKEKEFKFRIGEDEYDLTKWRESMKKEDFSRFLGDLIKEKVKYNKSKYKPIEIEELASQYIRKKSYN